jgi:acyl-coenzyme A synthetase/AMP-(fatty) acid ligase
LPPAGSASVHGGHVVMTSGTTGEYKMVMRDAAMEASTLENNGAINGCQENSVVYVGDFPLLTAGGWRWPLLTWRLGATVVFHQGDDRLRSLLGGQITHAYATPATLAVLVRDAGEGRRRDDMRLLVTGGPLTLVMWQAAQARLTRQVCAMLASSEALALAVTPVESAADLGWHRIHASREVEVVDESDRPLPAGAVGLVRARLQDGLDRYLDDAASSQEYFRNGYFYSGDLGAFGPDGRLGLHGRSTDVINALGTKIATGPIEQKLADRYGAEGVCVFAAPNAAGEDEVHVVIQSAAPIDARLMEPHARELRGLFHAVHFHRVAQLPRNHMGKVQRMVLRQQILEKKQ